MAYNSLEFRTQIGSVYADVAERMQDKSFPSVVPAGQEKPACSRTIIEVNPLNDTVHQLKLVARHSKRELL